MKEKEDKGKKKKKIMKKIVARWLIN